MSSGENKQDAGEPRFPARVVSVYNEFRIVINRGREHGIEEEQRFLLYELGDEIVDPSTNESLGRLEVPKGTGTVLHLQDKMATIQSDRYKEPQTKVVKRGFYSLNPIEEEIIPSDVRLKFTRPSVGDLVKPV
jgi:hypothetical protein